MNYSRRQLEALGETLGDCVTRKEGGRIIYGGGGSSSAPSTQTQVSDLPDWAKPYAQETLEKTKAITASPYQTYDQPRIAGFSPMQQQAQEAASRMGTSGQLSTGTGLVTAAGLMGLGANYQPGYFGNQFRAPQQYQPSQFGMMQTQAPSLQQYQMGPAERASTQSFTQPGSAEAYMSPFMQNVVDKQTREAERQAGLAAQQQRAQSIQRGSFGGGRTAIREAAAARDLAQLKSDIYGTGQQAAFQNAQQQFNAEQQARMQAQLANQQAGLTVGGQNLAALLGTQQLGAGQNLQSQLANQQAYQNMLAQQEASRQFGYGQQMTAAQQRAQYGQAAQQLAEQSRQFGAGYGQQGLNTALQAAGQLGNLGQAEFGQQKDILGLQSQFGGQQQALQQQGLSQAYQDFLNQQNYPYKQLGFMSDMIQGMPLGQQSTTQIYQPPPSLMGQLGGIGMGLYGMSRMAEGGEVEEYADGGSVDAPDNVAKIVNDLSDVQLAQAKQAALVRGDKAQLDAIQTEESMRASERRGMAGAFNSLPYETQENVARGANGGIVAFADRGAVEDPDAAQRKRDREAMSSGFRRIGAAAMDVGTLPFRALGGAAETVITRPLRAMGLDVPYLPASYYGGDSSSMTPYMDKLRREAGEDKAAPADRSYDKAEEKRLSQPRAVEKKKTPARPANANAVINNAVAQMSKESGVPEESLRSIYESYEKSLSEKSAAEMKDLMAMAEKFTGRSKEVKEQALGKALAEFGFKWAAAAAQPGAKFLGSAATAAPTIAASTAESAKLAREMDQNDMKLRLNLKQFEIAQRKGDLATAASLAAQERQLMQQGRQLELQREQLAETARSNRAREGIAAQRATSGGGSMQKAYMAGITKAQDRAARIAKDNWGNIAVQQDLKKQGFQSFDQYYDHLVKKEMRRAVPISGVTAEAESDED
jgi:hypothetical protein